MISSRHIVLNSRLASPASMAMAAPAAAAAAAAPAPSAFLLQQRRTLMAENPLEIKKRIVSTKSIMKITKSMKMVSAAKLKQDERRLNEGKFFGQCLHDVLGSQKTTLDEVQNNAVKAKGLNDQATTLAVISSDRGLCGGVNSAVAKLARLRLNALAAANKPHSLFVLGLKGEGALRRTHGKKIVMSVDEAWKSPMNFSKACAIASRVLKAAGDSKKIEVIYNNYKSVIAYIPTANNLNNLSVAYSTSEDNSLPSPIDQCELEPEVTEEVLQNLTEFGLAASIYGAAIDNATSEQSARMTAMDNASKNAGEMIEKYTLQFNRARQSKITTELIEIISGAESLSASQ